MAELIRREVQKLCTSFSQEQQNALITLSEIKAEAKKAGISSKTALNIAIKAQKKARRERKTGRR